MTKHLESGVFYSADERVAIVELRGRLDREADPVILPIIQELIERAQNVIFCLHELKYFSPYGIRLLLDLQRELAKTGNTVVLAELSKKATTNLETTGLDRSFIIQPSSEVALFELLTNESISDS